MVDWHTLKTEEVLRRLGTDVEVGLSDTEAARRLAKGGPNELLERGTKSPWLIFWEQLAATMVAILLVAAGLSLFLGDYKDAIAILAIVVLNAALGFFQEYRAERAMAALRRMVVPTVKVMRSGRITELSARFLVPGDIIFLETGNLVPADARILESANLRVQEAALTGESEPVEKNGEPLPEADLPVGDRRNMAYLGTVVSYGRGRAVITATGMETELGIIAGLIQAVRREPTPLQKRLHQLGKGLGLAALILVGIVFGLGFLRGEELKLLFMTALSLGVAAVPEGLPAIVTIALALGAQRMLKRNALIRKLPAVETLGSVTVICSDKTGTLTENKMTVTILDAAGERLDLTEHLRRSGLVGAGLGERFPEIVGPAGEVPPRPTLSPPLRLLLAGGALCNDSTYLSKREKDGHPHVYGDPTEAALVLAAAWLGMEKPELERMFVRAGEVPFESERKRMTTVHRVLFGQDAMDHPLADLVRAAQEASFVAFTKGAVDGLLDVSTGVWVDGEAQPLTEQWKNRILSANNELAQKGMRVLGLAFRRLKDFNAGKDQSKLEQNLVFIGLVGMIDPPRPEAKDAVATCQRAGIRPVMITGDHPLTAISIARELGIARDGKVLSGRELGQLSVRELERVVEDIPVYARVGPEHKLKIVEALQKRGEVVAMTGDGVNDAPALRKADIGVAMGRAGTDVARETADMVLLDDNFATIVAAVKEGRAIYDNVRKFIKYLLTSNSGELWVMLAAPFLGMPLPLLPLQILWINLVTDGLPALALGVEPAERNLMRRPPYSPQENIFGRGMGRHIILVGFLMGVLTLGGGFWYWREGYNEWQTVVFTTLALAQMSHVLAIRSERESLFTLGLFSNRPLLGAVALTCGLQLLAVYHPLFQETLKTVSLSAAELLLCVVFSSGILWVVELEKWFLRRSSQN